MKLHVPACNGHHQVSTTIKKSLYTVYSRMYSALVFADFLNEKMLVRASNPHLSFNRPLPTRQTD